MTKVLATATAREVKVYGARCVRWRWRSRAASLPLAMRPRCNGALCTPSSHLPHAHAMLTPCSHLHRREDVDLTMDELEYVVRYIWRFRR